MKFTASVFCLAIALLCCTAGCGGGSTVKLYKVRGKVTLKGTPVGGAVVVLHPKDREKATYKAAQGVTRDDGTFDLGTNISGDGVMAGDYVITIAKRAQQAATSSSSSLTMGGPPGASGPGASGGGGGGDEYMKKMINSGQAKQDDAANNALPVIYAKPETTDKFVTINDSGPFEIPLDL
jgi:hypothetical protein